MREAADWQQADAAHYLHPFTDSRALAAKGTRVITRGEGIYIYDATGHKMLDGMSGLWCVNVGYGRSELIEAATPADERAAVLQQFFPVRASAGDPARGAARGSHARRTSITSSSRVRAPKPTTP